MMDILFNNISSKPIRQSFCTLVLLITLSGCGIAERIIDEDLSFSASSPEGLVIGGLDISRHKNVNNALLIFKRYDPETQKMMDDDSLFGAHHTWDSDRLSFEKVSPGSYILMDKIFHLNTRIGAHLNTVRASVSGRITSDTSVAGIKAFRFDVAAGEAVYLGEYVVGNFKPEWENQSDAFAAQMSKMKNISVTPVFRPPVIRSK